VPLQLRVRVGGALCASDSLRDVCREGYVPDGVLLTDGLGKSIVTSSLRLACSTSVLCRDVQSVYRPYDMKQYWGLGCRPGSGILNPVTVSARLDRRRFGSER
jgi:hypothetical protein